jgi:hypothetical protein
MYRVEYCSSCCQSCVVHKSVWLHDTLSISCALFQIDTSVWRKPKCGIFEKAEKRIIDPLNSTISKNVRHCEHIVQCLHILMIIMNGIAEKPQEGLLCLLVCFLMTLFKPFVLQTCDSKKDSYGYLLFYLSSF